MAEMLIVSDVEGNAELIFNRINRLEEGFRAVAVGYNEHIHDKNSFNNINRLRDSISYRLYAAREQHMIYTVGVRRAEKEILLMYKATKLKGITLGSQTFAERNNETNLSSYFDNIIFNLVSAFDYVAHLSSYCLYKNQDRTFDWDKLVKKAKSDKKFEKLKIVEILDQVNRNVVQALYDYRSRLIHRTRDRHHLKFEVDDELEKCRVMVVTSELATKKLKKLLFDDPLPHNLPLCSLNFTISKIILHCIAKMELVLDSLYEMILENSGWPHSAYAKPEDTFLIYLNPDTKVGEPPSKKMWKDFKSSL